MIKICNGLGGMKAVYMNYFSGGEVNVVIDPDYVINKDTMILVPQLVNPQGFFELIMTADAIRRIEPNIELVCIIGYFPYGRQDRVCNTGEALGAKVYAEMINAINFDAVVVADPHSDVIGACLNNCTVMEQHAVIKTQIELMDWITTTKPLIVSPDAGANKKTLKLCKELGIDSFIRADKTRDTRTGAITDTIVYENYEGELEDKHVLIVDDICDGGYTFIQLAKALKAKGVVTVSLFVTHGIFSKGVQVLLDNGIDHVYTTDSIDPIGIQGFDKITAESLYYS